jgi:hypothetical protein
MGDTPNGLAIARRKEREVTLQDVIKEKERRKRIYQGLFTDLLFS